MVRIQHRLQCLAASGDSAAIGTADGEVWVFRDTWRDMAARGEGPARRALPRLRGQRVSHTPVILTDGLTKSYGRHRGIADLGLEVRAGEVFGFLGPNGAGKTTT